MSEQQPSSDAPPAPGAEATSPKSHSSPKSGSSPPGSGASQAATNILPADHWAQLDTIDDGDSAIGEDADSSTASISSSILQYRTIHGRTYHSEQGNATYWGSNDEAQNEALDITHHTLTLGIGDKLHLAPLNRDKLEKVLDIGTGTGIWAIDFADEYPEAQVVGTDLSPIQPSWVPPNVQFEIEDCTREWTFAPNSADYVHMRWLVGSIADWDALFAEAFKACRPGGWLESHETSPTITSDDGTVTEDSALGQWGKFFIEGSKKLGTSFLVVEEDIQKQAMERAGFVDVQEFDFRCPIGDWPKDPIMKEMGRYTQFAYESDTEGSVLFMANLLGWTRPEIQVYVAHVRSELRAKKHHGFFRQKVVWGRKP